MRANRDNQSDLLRKVYLPFMRVQFNLKSILLQRLRRNTDEYAEGEELSLVLHVGQSGGWGWSSKGKLPAASHQKVKRHKYNYHRMYGTIEIDGPHVEGAKKSYAAERRPYDFETKNLVKQMRHGLNHDLFGNGSGKVATVASATSATQFTVGPAAKPDVKGLVDGMRIDVLDTATGAVNGGVTNAEIRFNWKSGLVTLKDGAVFADYGDVNANPGNYTVYRAGSYNDACMGLDGIISENNPATGPLGGIDRTDPDNSFWTANVFGNGGNPRVPDLVYVDEAVNEVEKRSSVSTSLIICSHPVWTILADQLVQDKRFAGTQTKLNGWARALMFPGPSGDIPIVRDKHCPVDKMYGLAEEAFTLYQNDEGKWIDEDGAVLHRIEQEHAFQAAWFRFLQLACDAPNGQWVLEDLDTALPIAA